MPYLFANPYLDAVLAAILLYMVVATWDTLFGPLMRTIAAAFDVTIPLPSRIPDIHLGFIADAIRGGERKIRRALGRALAAMVWPFVALLTFAATLFVAPARELYYLARDTTATLDRLRRDVIPAMIAAKVAWIPRHLAALEARIAGIPHVIERTAVHTVTRTVTHIERVVVRKAVAVADPRIGYLEREAGALARRLRDLARRAPVALTAAALTAIVARTSFRWLRCSRVNRVGKQVCGMDSGLLDALIADTVLIAGTISLVEFAEGLQAGMNELTPQVRKFWRVT